MMQNKPDKPCFQSKCKQTKLSKKVFIRTSKRVSINSWETMRKLNKEGGEKVVKILIWDRRRLLEYKV